VSIADLEQEFLRSDMLTLANAVKGEFVAAVLHDKPPPLHLTGRLSLLPESKTKANCTVIFTTDWMNIPPEIFCHDVWLRKEQDWHTNERGNLCYVLKAQWAKRLKDVASRHDIVGVVDYARGYLVRNTRWLLQRHWQGYQENIRKWKWVQWSHGPDGSDEFLEEEGRENPGLSQ
jgi:hypothetical protein